MAFDALLRKHFWIVPLPLVAIAALLNAQAISQLIGSGMELDPKELARPSPGSNRAPTPTSVERSVSADPILKRNPFDHKTGPLVTAPSASDDDDDGSPGIDTSDPWSAPACDNITVTAIAASDDADWSFAAVYGSDKKPRLVRRGVEIDSKKVHYVGRDRLWFSSGDGLCQAKLFDTKKDDAPAAAPSPPPEPSASRAVSRIGGAKPLDPDLKKGIQAVSPTEYNIDRGVVDKILENQAELMRQARIVPVQENGRVVGVRLLGVRQDALLGVLGMKNGDVLKTINGFEMGSPEKALEAYARLRTADKLTVQIQRDGKTINLDYNIR